MTGFPNDVKERELNNMLRFMPGYEASQMNWKNGQVGEGGAPSCFTVHGCTAALHACMDADHVPAHGCKPAQAQGFALFYTGVAARAACSALGGLR